MVVDVADKILQIAFIASPIKTVMESDAAKLTPEIVILYPPPRPPLLGEIELTII
jgi:hypothetical protein